MDLAYDHIQEDAYLKNPEESGEAPKKEDAQSSLNSDIQEAYKAFSASPWGAKLGGFFGNVVKQGESVYTQASKELAEVREDTTKGFSSLRETIVNRTRSLSLTTIIPEAAKDNDDNQTTPTDTRDPSAGEGSSSQDVISRLKTEAAKRLKDLQQAEDAADEALLKFGSNIRDFLRDAISIAPPDESNQSNQVLFESKDAQGKRVIHSSRFDAQLHVIHTSTESFTKDPSEAEYEQWTNEFDIDKKTGDISTDLAKYPELRSTMEKLVPDQIPYADFWKRYYFLRHGIQTAESRRRDLLKAASTEDEVAWDDSEEEAETDKSEKPNTKKTVASKGKKPDSVASSTTIQPPAKAKSVKPDEPRKSNDEKSEGDTDTSYDVVGAASGKASQVASQAPNSPNDPKKKEESDDSDEDEEEEDDSDEDSDDDEDDDDESDEDWE